MVSAYDKLVSQLGKDWNTALYNAGVPVRIKEQFFKDCIRWRPWSTWLALKLTQHKLGKDYVRKAVRAGRCGFGPAYCSDNAGDGPSPPLSNELWRELMHWELALAVKDREDRYLTPQHVAATKIQAWYRGREENFQLRAGILDDALFELEADGYRPEDHDEIAQRAGWFWANCMRYWWEAGHRPWGWSDEEGTVINRMDIEPTQVNDENLDPLDVTLHSFNFNINFGPEYSSDDSGDGPPSVPVHDDRYPDIDDVVIEEDDMEILLFRFEILTEMIDLQVWTYGMRLHEHEYRGEPFDHHEHLGTTEIFARISRFNNALHGFFRSGGGDCWIERDEWMSVLHDLETIERADMFHDVHCQEHLQSLVTDFILFSCMDDHHFEPRASDTCFQIPLF